MRKRGFIAFLAVILLATQISIAFGEEACILYHHKACHNGHIWWFDSCDSPHLVSRYCNYNEECVEGQCKQKCGNGNCDSGENCDNCIQDCPCADSERCWFSQCQTYCGNGRCDGDENCWSCTSDCGCESGKKCEGGKCRTYCGNGNCDGDENCGSCFSDCRCGSSEECSPGSARADRRGCASLCGNGRKDSGEDCSSCPADAGCTAGTHCYNGQCVDCIKDEHCTTRDTPTGEFICSSDFRSTLEKVVRKAGECQNHQCTGKEEQTTKPGKNCGDMLCQGGQCGCEEGYQACLATGKCEKVAVLEDGGNCGCYFQCVSNYCGKDGKCMMALNTPISATSNLITVGESAKITISADNSLDILIPTKLTLNIDSGAIMSGVIGGSDCSGNQCTSGSIPIQPKGRESVTIDVTGESAGKVKFTAVITAMIDDEEYPITKETHITIINPHDGQCTEGETKQNACRDCGCPDDTRLYTFVCGEDDSCHRRVGWWVFIGIAGFVVVVVLLYFGYTHGKRAYERVAKEWMLRKHLKEKAEAEKEAKEEAERKRVVKALYALEKKIDWENPPSIGEVLKKIKVKADEKLIHDEYLVLLEKKAKTKRLKGEEKKVEEAKKAQKFCTKCGAQIKPGVNFCTKCGSPVKKSFRRF